MAKPSTLTTTPLVLSCSMSLLRCNSNGTVSPNGTSVKIAKLKLTLDSKYDYTSIQSVTLSVSSGTSKSLYDRRSTLCSSAGYTETSAPVIFSGVAFDANTNYTFRLTVSPTTSLQDQKVAVFVQTFVLNRARCIMDFSPSGGVGIGTFVSNGSGRPDPRFEVASTHPAYFMGGINGVTNYKVGTTEATGGKIYDCVVDRYVWELAAQDPNSTKYYSAPGMENGRSAVIPISFHGAARRTNGSIVPLPYVGPSADEDVRITITSATQMAVTTGTLGIANGYVIIEYREALGTIL